MPPAVAEPRLATVSRLPYRAAVVVAIATLASIVWEAISARNATPAASQLPLGAYFQPSVLAAYAQGWASSALLPMLLAWGVMRSHLDRRDTATVRPRTTLAAFAVLYFALGSAFLYGEGLIDHTLAKQTLRWLTLAPFILPPIIFAIQLLIMMLLYAVAGCVITFVAARLALALGARGPTAQAYAQAFPAPGVHSVPVLCALFALAIEWQFQTAGQQVFYDYRQAHPVLTATGAVLGPILVFTLAWLGARSGVGLPDRLRPLRAFAVGVVTLAVKLSATLAIGTIATFLLTMLPDSHRVDTDDVIGLAVLLTLSWVVLSVVLMRWFSAIFYDPFQRQAIQTQKGQL